jgi:hypothetical protein
MLNYDSANNQRIAQAVTRFSRYSDEIESILTDSLEFTQHYALPKQITGILNGEATSALQRLVPVAARKEAGIFFTSTDLADKVAKHLAPMLRMGVELLDPACGAGNLLVACSRYLPSGKSFGDTVRIWAELIRGYDLFPEFIRAARLRLTLAAANIHSGERGIFQNIDSNALFQGLKVGNVFYSMPIPFAKCVAVNPPFGYMPAPKDCEWANGKIQIAGWFIEKLLRMAPKGQHVVAILPDVLNSGTRYKKWRDLILTLVSSITIEPAGRFDPNTDVDVFILHAVAGNDNNMPSKWPYNQLCTNGFSYKVSDYFDVHVGSVVPHRDPTVGISYPYVHARTALPWQTLEYVTEERRSIHTVFSPPFVVIHRTSSPSDKHRCIATIINEKREVAVENHLIVLLPKDKALQSCKQLLSILESPATDRWLNQRIRCRHLTVSAIRDLPCHAIGTS